MAVKIDPPFPWLLEPPPVRRHVPLQSTVVSEILTDFLQAPICVWIKNNQPVVTSAVVLIATVLFTSTVLDCLIIGAILFVPEELRHIFWEALVTLTPGPVIFWLEDQVAMPPKKNKRTGKSAAQAKSEALANVLQVGPSGSRTKKAQYYKEVGSASLRSAAIDPMAPPGIVNPDVQCYRNSTLQGLASLDALSTYLDRVSAKAVLQGVRGDDLETVSYLRSLVDVLRRPIVSGPRAQFISPVMDLLPRGQQDAQEYLTALLDKVETEVIKAGITVKKHSLIAALDSSSNESTGTLDTPVKESQGLRLPLETITAERKSCTVCGYADSMRLVPTTCITLNMPDANCTDSKQFALGQLLDMACASETLEGVNCSACTLRNMEEGLLAKLEHFPCGAELKARLSAIQSAIAANDYSDATLYKLNILSSDYVRTDKVRQTGFAIAPDALAFQVNRSAFDRNFNLMKDSRAVEFPEHLDFSPWYMGSDLERPRHSIHMAGLKGTADEPMLQELKSRPKTAKYVLRSAVMHNGALGHGHYYSYRQGRFGAMRAMEDKLDGDIGQRKRSIETETDSGPAAKKFKSNDAASISMLSEETGAMDPTWWLLDDAIAVPKPEEAVFNQCEKVYMVYYDRVYDEEEAPAAIPEATQAAEADRYCEYSEACTQTGVSPSLEEVSDLDTEGTLTSVATPVAFYGSQPEASFTCAESHGTQTEAVCSSDFTFSHPPPAHLACPPASHSYPLPAPHTLGTTFPTWEFTFSGEFPQ